MKEFATLKNAHSSKGFDVVDGTIKICNKYENFAADPESIRHAKTPYFLKVSKIREVICFTEGAFSETAYKEWRNTLHKAGYADSIVHKEEQRLLTSEELEAAGQFFPAKCFSESSRGRTSIEMATVRVSMGHRISMELAPKPIYPGSFREDPIKGKPENQDVLKPPTLTKGQRKRQKKRTKKG